MKIVAGLVFISLKITGAVITVLSKVASIIAGPFLVFIIGCGIYCGVIANWKSLIILAVIGGAVIILFMLIGLLLGAVDIGINGARRRLRN